MMNRRQFVYMGGAALFAHVPNARAATYDLLIEGGRVIDPSVGLDAIRDIAIAAGKIVAVEADIAGDASQTIDARGKIVAPGLIDIHTHAGRSKEGPPLLLQDGVTGWVDAGSGGSAGSSRKPPGGCIAKVVFPRLPVIVMDQDVSVPVSSFAPSATPSPRFASARTEVAEQRRSRSIQCPNACSSTPATRKKPAW